MGLRRNARNSPYVCKYADKFQTRNSSSYTNVLPIHQLRMCVLRGQSSGPSKFQALQEGVVMKPNSLEE